MSRACALVLGLGALGVDISAARNAAACATCDAGDQTLTVNGAELPFAGRLRSAFELRRRSDAIGQAGIDRTELVETRLDLTMLWAPGESISLMAMVPLAHRRITDASLVETDTWGVGDVELRAKWFAFKDRDFAPRVLGALVGGVRLPVAPWHHGPSGELFPLEAQLGAGSVDALLGPSFAVFDGQLSAYLGVLWSEPLRARSALEPGRALRGSLSAQYQLVPWLGLRAASDLRWSAPARERGQRDPSSGGWIQLAGGDLLVSVAESTVLLVGLRVPVVDRLAGAHDEGSVASFAILQDW